MSKKSAVVSGMGLGLGMLTNADQIRKEMGITDEEFHVLATEAGNKHWRRLFEGMLQKKEKDVSHDYETYTVTTGIYKSLEEAIKAGNYDYCNPGITSEHFSLSGGDEKNVEITLIHRDKLEQSQLLIDEFVTSGEYRNITTEETLALGAQYPELQRKFPIIALGTVVRIDGYRRALILHECSGKRRLILDWSSDTWVQECRFAFVRKKSK